MSNHITVIESEVPRTSTYRQHADRVAAYLPANFSVVAPDTDDVVRIAGMDRMGFTAEDYVLPRLASGLIFGEIVMTIPVTDDLREMILFASTVSASDAS